MNFQESDIIFNAERHTYELPGIGEIPGVSEVLSAIGFNRFVRGTDRDLTFGDHVHKMVELDQKGDLDTESLSEGLQAPYRAYCKFKKERPYIKPIKNRIEKPSFHPLYLYAGIPDLPSWDEDSGCYHLIDVKTGCYCSSYRLQTAGYEQIERHWLKVRRSAKFKRSILFLRADCENYILQPLTDKTDSNAWLNVLGTYNFMKANGYLNNRED
jgi:hypothetical protein